MNFPYSLEISAPWYLPHAPIPYSAGSIFHYCAFSFKNCIFVLMALIFRYLYLASFILGAIFLVWAGILFIVQGKPEEGRKRLLWAVIGLVVALISYAVTLFIYNVVLQQPLIDDLNSNGTDTIYNQNPRGCDIGRSNCQRNSDGGTRSGGSRGGITPNGGAKDGLGPVEWYWPEDNLEIDNSL